MLKIDALKKCTKNFFKQVKIIIKFIKNLNLFLDKKDMILKIRMLAINYLLGDISSGSLLRNLFRAGMHGSVKLFSSLFLGRRL